MDIKEFTTKILESEKTGLIILALGVVCIAFASTNGMPKYNLIIDDQPLRYGLSLVGLAVTLSGLFLVLKTEGTSSRLGRVQKYGVKIDYPIQRAALHSPFTFAGKCKRLPEGYRLWIFGTTLESSGRRYWPKSEIQVVGGKWSTEVQFSRENPGNVRRIGLFLVGEDGSALIDMYQAAGRSINAIDPPGRPWTAMPALTSDIVEVGSLSYTALAPRG